jgi:ABC-2 type transport system permease protein
MGSLFTAMFSGVEVIWDKQFGFLKETLVAPVPRFQIMLGRTLGGATVATMQGILVFIVAMLAGFRPESAAMLPLALLFVFLISLFFTALGTALASLLDDMQGFQLIMSFLVMPVFFLSGSLFPLAGLQGPISWLARADPLSYGVDGLRAALTGASNFGLGPDLLILFILAMAFVGIGSRLFSRIQI